MSRHLSKVFPVVLVAMLASGCANRQNGTAHGLAGDEELGRIRTAVERTLTSPPPRGYEPIPRGVRLLAISRGEGRVIFMNFNEELAAGGRGKVLEDALHQIFAAASNARADTADRADDYRVQINGVALDAYLR